MIARNEKIGRNEPCKCGSGKKFKKCCDPKLAKAKKKAQIAVFELAMRKALYLIVKLKGPINLTHEQLNSVPCDFEENFEMTINEQGFVYSIKKKEGVLELPPDRQIIV